MADPRFFEPLDASAVPRFGGVPTFMRLPVIEDPAQLDIALIGVPWDGGTTNRPGARHGPREIRNQSSLMRRVHQASGIIPYELCRIADAGDAPVNPVNLMETLDSLRDHFRKATGAGAMPLTAGGDHLITLPILEALAEAHGQPVAMIQFDAHSDTNESYFGEENRYTHGTPFRRAIEAGALDPGRTVQIGLRGSLYHPGDLDFARDRGIRALPMEVCYSRGLDAIIAEARDVVGDAPVYITFDVDSLDPAFAPGTGTPEVGGFSTIQAQHMVRGLRGLNLIGADVVEVSPPFDPSGATALVGATMMFELMCLLAEAHARRRG